MKGALVVSIVLASFSLALTAQTKSRGCGSPPPGTEESWPPQRYDCTAGSLKIPAVATRSVQVLSAAAVEADRCLDAAGLDVQCLLSVTLADAFRHGAVWHDTAIVCDSGCWGPVSALPPPPPPYDITFPGTLEDDAHLLTRGFVAGDLRCVAGTSWQVTQAVACPGGFTASGKIGDASPTPLPGGDAVYDALIAGPLPSDAVLKDAGHRYRVDDRKCAILALLSNQVATGPDAQFVVTRLASCPGGFKDMGVIK